MARSSRPYIICHIFSSIDGRIDGPFMFDSAASRARTEYGRLQGSFDVDAIAYGAVTTEGFVGAGAPVFTSTVAVKQGDYVAPHTERSYYVSIDPDYRIAWPSGTYRRAGRAPQHVIEVLREDIPSGYLSFLRDRGVSYVLAGARALDLPLAMEKLRLLFGIRRLLVCGGGATDAAFLAAGLIDELSIVMAPVASGERGVATIFDESPFAPATPRAFHLERADRIEHDGLHLIYKA